MEASNGRRQSTTPDSTGKVAKNQGLLEDGQDTDRQNFYFQYLTENENLSLISFEDLQKIRYFPKLQGRSSKNERATSILILKCKWTWQVQFKCHTLETLTKYVFCIDI